MSNLSKYNRYNFNKAVVNSSEFDQIADECIKEIERQGVVLPHTQRAVIRRFVFHGYQTEQFLKGYMKSVKALERKGVVKSRINPGNGKQIMYGLK